MNDELLARLLTAESPDDVERIVTDAPESERAGLRGVATLVKAHLRLQTEHRRLLAENRTLARADLETDLPTRRVFEERLRAETLRVARTRRSFALAMIDVEGAGAHGLGACAEVMRAYCRDADFIARLGDERFALILIDSDTESAEAAVARVIDRLRAIEAAPGRRISPAIGVAVAFPVDSAETLLERADNALYAAQQAGGGIIKA